MSNEILSVLQFMEKEKGIDRNDMIEAITSAIKHSAQRGVNAGQELKIEIDPRTGALKAWSLLKVVDSVSDPLTEIHIEKARVEDDELQLGDTLEHEMDPAYLGRIAAQTARQAIMQRIRQFEKDHVYDEFKDSIGDILTGVVRRRDRNDLLIEIGTTETTLWGRERIPGEDYAPGERIRCLLLNIESTPRGPELHLTRSHGKFVRRLFELEVSEINDGTVEIKTMAREPGYRTKVAVYSDDPKIDPVGACVGARGARVKSIVRELNGEKVDILRYYEDPVKMLEEAVKPAIPRNISIDHQGKRIHFEVEEKDLSLTIGKQGLNARLISKLMGWRLDIAKESSEDMLFEKKMRRAIQGITQISGIADKTAIQLVNNGITSPEAFEGVTAGDLQDMGFPAEVAEDILNKVNAFLTNSAS